MKRTLVAGEINADIVLQGYHSFPTPGREVLVDGLLVALGSASAICAVGLARLGDAVSFLGVVGDDLLGDYCLDQMRAGGVDVSPVRRGAEWKTGLTVSISSSRDRALVTFPGAICALAAEDVSDELLRAHAHLHVSSFYLQERLRPGLRSLFVRAHALGLTTSLDPGFDPAERWGADLGEALEGVDLFFPNEVELEALTGSADVRSALTALSNGRTLVVAKLGARGCATLEGDRLVEEPAFPLTPVDTTGAGDSFNAGFLHAWLAGRPLRDCLRLGTACGALSTRGLGGTATQATCAEAEALLAQRP